MHPRSSEVIAHRLRAGHRTRPPFPAPKRLTRSESRHRRARHPRGQCLCSGSLPSPSLPDATAYSEVRLRLVARARQTVIAPLRRNCGVERSPSFASTIVAPSIEIPNLGSQVPNWKSRYNTKPVLIDASKHRDVYQGFRRSELTCSTRATSGNAPGNESLTGAPSTIERLHEYFCQLLVSSG